MPFCEWGARNFEIDYSRCGAPRPPMTDVGTETAFRLDQRKHFRKSKPLEVRGQLMRSSPASIYIYWWVDRSTCLASRILSQNESFPGPEFKPASIWTSWMLIDRQMQSPFMPELHRWISKLTARHLSGRLRHVQQTIRGGFRFSHFYSSWRHQIYRITSLWQAKAT